MKLEIENIRRTYFLPLMTLVRKASVAHSDHFPSNEIQASTLISLKTGGCSENCAYCPQSAHYQTNVRKEPWLEKSKVISAARHAQSLGASRFCMGAAWREVKDGSVFDLILELVSTIRDMGLEVCCTLGMLCPDQAARLKKAGLHFYNHNLDTSRKYYSKIIQTRTYDDRLKTLENVRQAGIAVCTGGILGLGESHDDRIEWISELVHLKPKPESITVNTLVTFAGTPLEKSKPVDPLDVVRVIACLRIFAPSSFIRLSAGRLSMSAESQFLCFLAGANSIFLGEKLLTSPNPSTNADDQLMKKIGIQFSKRSEK